MKIITLLSQLFDPNAINIPKPAADQSRVEIVLEFVFALSAALAVLIIAIAGLNYVLSAGDPQKTAKAKDAILYAVIGLAVSIFGYVIVAFVIGRIL